MNIDQILKIFSPILTAIIGTIIKYLTESRSKIISYIGHISSFKLHNDDPNKEQMQIYTHSIIVHNAGNKSANNIRIGHYFLPSNFNLYPSVQYSIETNPENIKEILIPILVPKEQITISYLYFPPITWDKIHSYTKSDDGLAKIINVIPMQPLPKLNKSILSVLIFVGSSFLIYLVMKLIINII